jgi:hypothetical protein
LGRIIGINLSFVFYLPLPELRLQLVSINRGAQFESGHWSSASHARLPNKTETFPAAIHDMTVATFHALPPAYKIYVSLEF